LLLLSLYLSILVLLGLKPFIDFILINSNFIRFKTIIKYIKLNIKVLYLINYKYKVLKKLLIFYYLLRFKKKN
jgi:hypothetical protein